MHENTNRNALKPERRNAPKSRRVCFLLAPRSENCIGDHDASYEGEKGAIVLAKFIPEGLSRRA